MSTDTVTLFLALLAVVAQIGVLAAVVLRLGRGVPSIARLGDEVVAVVAPVALPLALAVAATSTAGSLWLSEGAGFPPCTLCWYQRIAMYPLVVVLTVALVTGDRLVRRYVLPIAAIGSVVSIYHLLVERYPNLETGSCDPTNPCSIIWVKHFGYVTIPMMALSGFLAIAVLTAVAARAPVEPEQGPPSADGPEESQDSRPLADSMKETS